MHSSVQEKMFDVYNTDGECMYVFNYPFFVCVLLVVCISACMARIQSIRHLFHVHNLRRLHSSVQTGTFDMNGCQLFTCHFPVTILKSNIHRFTSIYVPKSGAKFINSTTKMEIMGKNNGRKKWQQMKYQATRI